MKKNLFNVFLVCVFCVAAIPDMFAQQIKVTGKVTDSTNEGMPGVNVQVKGTATGTITDFDGNYSIDVPDSKSTLVFSFIGYVTQQVPVGGKKVLNVQLKDDTQTLDEVVVVAYGTARKSDLTGATASLRPDANDASKTASFNNLLQGKVAGLNVTSSMAAPGAASSVTIRGANSLRGDNQPLYVIDNVPGYSKLWKNFSWDLAFYRIKIIDKENHLFCYNQSSLGRAFTINFVKDIVTVNHHYDFVGQEFLTTEHLTKLWRILQC